MEARAAETAPRSRRLDAARREAKPRPVLRRRRRDLRRGVASGASSKTNRARPMFCAASAGPISSGAIWWRPNASFRSDRLVPLLGKPEGRGLGPAEPGLDLVLARQRAARRATARGIGRPVRRTRRLGRSQLGLRPARVRALQPGSPRRGRGNRRAHRDRGPETGNRWAVGMMKSCSPASNCGAAGSARASSAAARPSSCSGRSATTGARSWRRRRSCAARASSASTSSTRPVSRYYEVAQEPAGRRHARIPAIIQLRSTCNAATPRARFASSNRSQTAIPTSSVRPTSPPRWASLVCNSAIVAGFARRPRIGVLDRDRRRTETRVGCRLALAYAVAHRCEDARVVLAELNARNGGTLLRPHDCTVGRKSRPRADR